MMLVLKVFQVILFKEFHAEDGFTLLSPLDAFLAASVSLLTCKIVAGISFLWCRDLIKIILDDGNSIVSIVLDSG